jgi:hypothetical protein
MIRNSQTTLHSSRRQNSCHYTSTLKLSCFKMEKELRNASLTIFGLLSFKAVLSVQSPNHLARLLLLIRHQYTLPAHAAHEIKTEGTGKSTKIQAQRSCSAGYMVVVTELVCRIPDAYAGRGRSRYLHGDAKRLALEFEILTQKPAIRSTIPPVRNILRKFPGTVHTSQFPPAPVPHQQVRYRYREVREFFPVPVQVRAISAGNP